ncbi:uncharacterized protein DUF2802 [Sulfuritortus calidifontis]|uniref:Uncharacterized protein DUF2802 n=1 Tax=Sulfuritortus calidifontis TaxID=1914471 RepID=A0A4V2UQE3_9PROT|nr:DUF2802 domain-containing protein [Sulfuritortus calidifontis]TCS70140.1 uncharacterized protein DUF2802 [Sulfuritortus calidifontis]
MTLPELPPISINAEELLLAVVLATLIYLVEWLLFSRNRRSKAQPAVRVEPQAGNEAEVAMLKAQVLALSARLEILERELVEQSARLGEAKPAAPRFGGAREEAALSPYAQATQLARQGATASELTERCGISRGEAELIVALNQPPSITS